MLTFDAKWLAQFDWLTALDDPQVTDVQDLIKAARSLPPDKQVELLQGLVQSLAQVLSPLAPASAEFWAHRSIEDLIRQQKVTAVHDIGALAMADWPDDESADDFIAYINAQCH